MAPDDLGSGLSGDALGHFSTLANSKRELGNLISGHSRPFDFQSFAGPIQLALSSIESVGDRDRSGPIFFKRKCSDPGLPVPRGSFSVGVIADDRIQSAPISSMGLSNDLVVGWICVADTKKWDPIRSIVVHQHLRFLGNQQI